MPSASLLEAVAVTAELCGRVFSEPAARVFVNDLSGYPEQQVIGALARCRKEVRGMLTVADVIQRLEDGRPGVEEAWSMLPRSESESVVWTDEMSEAFAVASRIMDDDNVAARMAFKEAYKRAVDKARERAKPVNWCASLGHDPRGREGALLEAVELGRITAAYAIGLAPEASGAIESRVNLAIGRVTQNLISAGR
jgi:hypothetical protein